MVDRSLMGLAADRGVTICFADLDGADGLWVPEERTILVSRRLSEQRVNEVIEHELAHVAIDDQHAELDAGVWQKPSRTAALMSRRWTAPALSIAALVALVGGVTLGLTAAKSDAVPRDLTTTPLPTPSEASPQPPVATTTRITYVDSSGNTTFKTITISPSVPASPSGSASGSRSVPGPVPPRKSGQPSSTPEVVPPTMPTATTPPPSPTATPDPTTPASSPTSPPAASATVGADPTG